MVPKGEKGKQVVPSPPGPIFSPLIELPLYGLCGVLSYPHLPFSLECRLCFFFLLLGAVLFSHGVGPTFTARARAGVRDTMLTRLFLFGAPEDHTVSLSLSPSLEVSVW